MDARKSSELLRTVDRQLAAIEDSMEQVHALLRPGAQHGSTRRMRSAGQKVAQVRLECVRDAP